ncbi:MAG: COX15/CtaA family protein [Alphaproteobacteria bacterium]
MQSFRRGMCCLSFLILGMVVLGGITRLTGSGLSLVTWEPFSGALPPLSQAAWERLFQQYQTSPEFQKINFSFGLEEFKHIFWWEYIHRLWGRLLGLVLLVPTYLVFRSPFSTRDRIKISLLWLGGALQALMGWWMVQSGLVDTPWVSPYKLALHLTLGLGLYSLTLDLALDHGFLKALRLPRAFSAHSRLLLVSLGCTLFWGALVAGQHAGLLYNTFPLMGGSWIPEDGFALQPLWKNFLENPALVQWTHRILALISLTILTSLVVRSYRHTQHRFYGLLGFGGALQVGLGIGTLLYQVPTELAVLHQLGAFFLWSLAWPLAFPPSFHTR